MGFSVGKGVGVSAAVGACVSEGGEGPSAEYLQQYPPRISQTLSPVATLSLIGLGVSVGESTGASVGDGVAAAVGKSVSEGGAGVAGDGRSAAKL